MPRDLFIYNTLTREKEKFQPLIPDHVGLYVCGPTVYGDPHLGHARPGVVYDVFVRLLRNIGYKVRYVRNITDVGHLENDSDTGEDKIAKKARLEELEPMEVVQYYTIRYHRAMAALNTLPPSIEPRASGHITEQIAMIQQILDAGMAYEINGSVYLTWKNTTTCTITESCPGAYWKTFRPTPGPWTVRMTNGLPLICPVEKSLSRTHHALAFSMERRLPRVASGMLGNEFQIPGSGF